MLQNPSKEEAIRLAKAGFNDVLEQQVRACTAPLFWYDPDRPMGDRILANGTMFFVGFSDRVVGITADHVYARFLEVKSENAEIRSAVFDQDFDIQERLISRSDQFDVATFDIPAVLVPTFGGAAPHVPIDWPPATPQAERGVILAGYPGKESRIEDGQDLGWTPFCAFTVINVVEPDRIMIQFDRDYLIDPNDRGLPPEDLWLGGLSGCPLFSLWESKASGIIHLQLAGIAVQFVEEFGIARFAPASILTTAGKIDPNAAA